MGQYLQAMEAQQGGTAPQGQQSQAPQGQSAPQRTQTQGQHQQSQDAQNILLNLIAHLIHHQAMNGVQQAGAPQAQGFGPVTTPGGPNPMPMGVANGAYGQTQGMQGAMNAYPFIPPDSGYQDPNAVG